MLRYVASTAKVCSSPLEWQQFGTYSSPILGQMLDLKLHLIHNPVKATLKALKFSIEFYSWTELASRGWEGLWEAWSIQIFKDIVTDFFFRIEEKPKFPNYKCTLNPKQKRIKIPALAWK